MSINPLASPSLFPRCPECGLYFVDLDASLLRAAKQKFGWRIGRFDPHLPREQWDAVRAKGEQHCPRCNAFILDVIRNHDYRHRNWPRRPRKRDKRRFKP